VLVPIAGMIFVEISVHIPKGPMIGIVLGLTVKSFLVGTLVGITQVLVQLPMPGVVVIVIVRKRGYRSRAQC
jgi:hypothetical protein